MQCYYRLDNNNYHTQCGNEIIKDFEYWCSQEHEDMWKQVNYQDNRIKGTRQLEIKEIQKRLKAIQLKMKEERFKKQQSLF
jgi:hypothetical protein